MSAAAAHADLHSHRNYYDLGPPQQSQSQSYASDSQGTANTATTTSYDPYAEPAVGGRMSRRPDCARKLVVVGDGGEFEVDS